MPILDRSFLNRSFSSIRSNDNRNSSILRPLRATFRYDVFAPNYQLLMFSKWNEVSRSLAERNLNRLIFRKGALSDRIILCRVPVCAYQDTGVYALVIKNIPRGLKVQKFWLLS